ncbi:hypothetical protein [Aquirufa ecclesiirivi]|uniref:Protein BatD n=1 Tax=Aquirufa ecclesiirivi TaxID=2715124 RepID=A0ABT4JFV4_9BACT|nr:hypothetical protein [Aquirufa ecclesiirivi]MCZ2473378.1 hypothetical protein [Aquirufa ecclesiirivi]MCZ2475161.1 hypothetical protein [Aquirufa ecclesiirivi]MDF0692422.1 hypothetical protein [Aquirufa ecclesiirivi]
MQQKPIQIKGQFLEDSVKIGQQIHYSLSVRHGKNQEIFFPSVNQTFGAFQAVERTYFPTRTDESGSIDSAVYTFQLFRIENQQSLAIPVYLMQEADCTKIYPIKDHVYLKRLVPHPEKINLDSLYQHVTIAPLQPKTDLKNVVIWGLGLLIFTGLIYWFLGNSLKKWFKLYVLWRKNAEFRRFYQRYIRNIENNQMGLQNLERAFSLWKKYLESLTLKPFTTFTTKEMVDTLENKQLAKALHELDSTIYGGNFSGKTTDSVNMLLEIANSIYQEERTFISQENKKP